MRAATWLLLLVVLSSSTLAGCFGGIRPRASADTHAAEPTGPEPIGTERGRDFNTVAAPGWKPGFHFVYEEAGSFEIEESGAGFQGPTTQASSSAWGPRQGLNYTVVNLEPSFGEERALAVQHDEGGLDGGPRLLSFDPAHLVPQQAYISTSCYSYHSPGGDCGNYVYVLAEEESTPPLAFPIDDKSGRKQVAEGQTTPPILLQPVNVVTKVLGLKEIAGPYGPVQAVHVHQDLSVNVTQILNESREQAEADGIRDLELTIDVQGTRDVFYAPSLLNIVLDQAESRGEYNGSYRRGDATQTFRDSWSSWSTQRLTAATFDEVPALSVDELSMQLHDGRQDMVALPAQERITLELSDTEIDVGEEEAVAIDLVVGEALDADRVRIDVLDAFGAVVASSEATSMLFQPNHPDPYLVAGYAYDADGVLLGEAVQEIAAGYTARANVDCGPVVFDGGPACPTTKIPPGFAIAFVSIFATIQGGAPAVGPTGGRLVLDLGNGQEISSDTGGSFASLWVEWPRGDPEGADWDLRYEPEVGVMKSVEYEIQAWPGSLPSYVYWQAHSNA